MAFDSFSEFLAMGKHGAYVWSAYGLTVLVIVVNIVQTRMRKKHITQQIARNVKRETSAL